MRPRKAALLFATAATTLLLSMLGVPRLAVASVNLDPFAKARASGRSTFDPVRVPVRAVAQAPAEAPTPAAGQAAPAPPAAGQACTRDDQCRAGTICERGVCTPFERPISVLLFRKEGGFTGFIPFYFHNRGNPGYRWVLPFYYHTWSPEGRSRIVAPFYWRFENHLSQRIVTVVVPYVHTVQPDAESWAVWPIFYASTKFGWAAPLLFSFKIANPDEGRSWGLYALLYFWKRDSRAGTALDVSPLFVSKRSRGGAFSWILPLNFYWRTDEDRRLLALPLFYRSAHPRGGTLATPLGYSSREGANRRGSVLWLYWFGRQGERRYDVVFPLAWSFRSPNSNTTVAANFVHLRRGSWSLSTFFPIYWSGRDLARDSGWKLLLPLYFSRRGERGASFTWMTPFGGYGRDDESRSRTAAFWLPPLIYRRDPVRELDMVALLYWRHKSLADGAITRLVGPFYLRRDPAGTTASLFPLFWYFRDAGQQATAHTFFPLYFRRRSPDETTTAAGVFPAWFYYRSFRRDGAPDGWSGGLFPLAFFGRRGADRHAVLFPVFWHFKDERASTTVSPVYYRFADRTGSAAGVPPLLYFQGHDRHSSYKVQFPLFWRFTDARQGWSTTAVPPLFFKSKRDGWSAGLFPLLFAGSSRTKGHFVLFPVVWRFSDDEQQRSTTVVLNYLHRRHGEQRTDALLPLLYYRRGAKPGGSDETSFTLFPLAHYRRDAQTTTFVSPLAAFRRTPQRRAGFVLPYFWWDGPQISAKGVPPVFFDFTRKDTGVRTRLWGPWVQIDGPRSRSRVLFPLFGRYADDRETGTWVFPTYFRRRVNDGYAVDTLLPLFWWSRGPGYGTSVVGPWFRRYGEGRYSTGLLPLYVYARDAKRQLFVTPIFFHHRNYEANTSRQIGAFLFYRTTRPDGHTAVLFPLWWSGRDKARSHAVLFPVYWHFANAEQDRSMTLAGPLYWSRRGAARTRGLMPLAWYSRDDEKGTASHALLPLFYEKHGREGLTVLTLPFGFRRAPDRNWWYVGPVFRRETVTSTFTMVAPLWFSHLNKGTETRTRVVPPLLHFSRSRPDGGLSVWFGFFWRNRTIGSATTLVLPLFYDVHTYHQRRTTLLLPLFLRHRNEETREAYSFAPLFYRRSGPADSTTVLFPLLWDWNSAAKRTTILFPLFAHFRRPTWTAKYVFPNIYYRSGLGPDEGTFRFFVFPFWESAAKRRGDYMWEVLLGLFGGERIGRNRYLKLFFIPIELSPAPAASTAWYGRSPTTRPRTRAVGVNTQVW